MEPFVVLVDIDDNDLGTMPKLEAHEKGMLHRAISVFLFDYNGNWIVQQRALDKYHSSGLWTNTCCSHPYPNETAIDAASRRLMEEMGVECELNFAFKFMYQTKLDNNFIEHELDHVFVGFTNQLPKPNVDEVKTWKLMSFLEIHQDVQNNPDHYTEWFKLLYQKVNLFL